MSKDKKKKKKVHADSYTAPSTGSAARWQMYHELNWNTSTARTAVDIEFEYAGTRYRGTAYPVGDAE